MSAPPFTGRHLALVVGGGFALVIAVNLLMAVLATGTFTGAVVGNGYVASQDFNRWLARGRVQQAIGWRVAATVPAGRLVVTVAGPDGAAVSGLAATAVARHPLDAARTLPLPLAEVAPGRYQAAARLPRGQWDIAFTLDAGPAGSGDRRLLRTDRVVVP